MTTDLRLSAVVVLLLTGCATTAPERDDGLLDITEPSPEQIQREREQDKKSAQEADEWLTYVCAQPPEEQRKLIEETRQKQGWQMACPQRRPDSSPPADHTSRSPQ